MSKKTQFFCFFLCVQKIVVPVYTDTYMGGAQRQVSWAVILSENSRLFSVYCLVRKEMEWINRGLRLHQKIKRSDQVWFACNVSSCCYCFSSVYCPRMSNTISSCVCEWVCVCVLQFVGDTTMPLKSLFVHKRKRRGGGWKRDSELSVIRFRWNLPGTGTSPFHCVRVYFAKGLYHFNA